MTCDGEVAFENLPAKEALPMSKPLAVICLSGGMDSCIAVAMAAREYEPAFLHVNYGQRTEAREQRCFREIADHFGATHRLVVDLPHLGRIGASALTDRTLDVPAGDLSRPGIPLTYVPFRNANILSAAVAWAEAIGAVAVVIGAVEEDSSGYPDCRQSFYDAFQRAVDEGTRDETRIRILTPVIGMRKSEIVRKGVELNAPLHLTWSCYVDEDVACGQCDSCLLRMKAFREAGVEDPIPYRKEI
jgi:7-cyano-7-deazaguanine synthase